MTLDPRITPARPDLAAQHLEGKVEAARFAAGEDYEVIDAQAPLRRHPAPDAPLDTEALMGERATVYEFNQEGWAWALSMLAGASRRCLPRDPPTRTTRRDGLTMRPRRF